MKRTKKWVAWVLTVILLVNLLPVAALAVGESGLSMKVDWESRTARLTNETSTSVPVRMILAAYEIGRASCRERV